MLENSSRRLILVSLGKVCTLSSVYVVVPICRVYTLLSVDVLQLILLVVTIILLCGLSDKAKDDDDAGHRHA